MIHMVDLDVSALHTVQSCQLGESTDSGHGSISADLRHDH
jgi:hypothetical protein